MSAKKGCCPRCLTGGYRLDEPAFDGRPSFTCDSCGNYWTEGKDGGESMKNLRLKQE